MAIEIQRSRPTGNDKAASDLISFLEAEAEDLYLSGAIVYYGYPRYRGENDELITAQTLIISPNHGVVVAGTLNATARHLDERNSAEEATESVYATINAKLLANRALRASPVTLKIPIQAFIYAPHLGHQQDSPTNFPYITSHAGLRSLFQSKVALDASILGQAIATIDGTRSLPRPKKREIDALDPTSKGRLVARLEAELATFDVKQREGSTTVITGPQRIRGLAGSGKTIVLTRKAALTHLEYQDASIAYTFHTKSLYQQIRRLITRFYRAEHDRDPDWSRVNVLHSWGGADPGIYSRACIQHGVAPLSYSQARAGSSSSPFGYACSTLLKATAITPTYDYIFIDEGQDYPAEFLQLCALLSKDMKFVYAYDDLQSIFQTRAADATAIFGASSDGESKVHFERDIVLYKCYRNPLEILVCAHAIGFGLYGKPVQMLENQDHWEDVGYKVEKGPLQPGNDVEILRPKTNSIPLLSELQKPEELIETQVYETLQDEVIGVAQAIASQIHEGLRPDDIVVAVVDDRHAREYLNSLAEALATSKIYCNNVHETPGVPEFQIDGRVTLTTVHKAKGNEGFAVHVMGTDAVFANPTKTNRNRLFTAMTRAKGWLRVTGVGQSARRLMDEIASARNNSPYLRFKYPSAQALEQIKRDLGKEAVLTQEQERMLDEIPDDQLAEYLQKRKKPTKRK